MRTAFTILCLLGAFYATGQSQSTEHQHFLLRAVGAFSEANAKVLFDEMRSLTSVELDCSYNPKSKEIAIFSKSEVDMGRLLSDLERSGWFVALLTPLPNGESSGKSYTLQKVRERWLSANPELRNGDSPVVFMTQREFEQLPSEKQSTISTNYQIIIE